MAGKGRTKDRIVRRGRRLRSRKAGTTRKGARKKRPAGCTIIAAAMASEPKQSGSPRRQPMPATSPASESNTRLAKRLSDIRVESPTRWTPEVA